MAFFRPAVSSICPCSDTCEIHGREWLYSKGPAHRNRIFCSTFAYEYGRVCLSRVCLGKHSVLAQKRRSRTIVYAHLPCVGVVCRQRFEEVVPGRCSTAIRKHHSFLSAFPSTMFVPSLSW